nr:hypothetical protein [Tanacetum cinerariifolium]
MDINIDDLYNILKQNQGDVNDAMRSKKKTVVVTSDPLALIAEKTNVSRSKEKVVISFDSEIRDVNDAIGSRKKSVVVTSDPLALIAEKKNVSRSKEKFVVSSDSEGSEADDFSELKKITTLLAKAFNRRKFYSKPTTNNLRTSSSYQLANKKQEFVKTDTKKVKKKDDEKKRHEQTKDQAWMESSSDSDQEINANMVFMAQIEKVLFDFEASSSSADEKISEITALLAKAFNRRKFYSKPTNNNLRTSSASQSANKKQEYVKSDDKKVKKKDNEKKRYMSKVKCYNCKKEGHFAKDFMKAKVKDYEYYKTKMLLTKKDKDEQVLLAEDHAWMESSSDSDQEINANMVFIAHIEKVLSDSEASSSSADDKISEVSYYLSKFENGFEYETSEYYDNTTTYGLFVNDNDDQEIFRDCENFLQNLIESQIDHNESANDHNDS